MRNVLFLIGLLLSQESHAWYAGEIAINSRDVICVGGGQTGKYNRREWRIRCSHDLGATWFWADWYENKPDYGTYLSSLRVGPNGEFAASGEYWGGPFTRVSVDDGRTWSTVMDLSLGPSGIRGGLSDVVWGPLGDLIGVGWEYSIREMRLRMITLGRPDPNSSWSRIDTVPFRKPFHGLGTGGAKDSKGNLYTTGFLTTGFSLNGPPSADEWSQWIIRMSSDNGMNWETVFMSEQLAFAGSNEVVVDSKDRIFATGYVGEAIRLIVSSDYGKSWTIVNEFLPPDQLPAVHLSYSHLVVDSADRLILYGNLVETEANVNKEIFLWISEDHGKTWRKESEAPGGEYFGAGIFCHRDAVYTTVVGRDNSFPGFVRRSTDLGKTWVLLDKVN